MPRWTHARGRLSLSRQPTWEAEQVAGEKAREERRALAAQRRAIRQLGEAREAARRLGVLHGTPEPSAEAVTAWEAIHAAAVACHALDVRVNGRRYGWDAEVGRAVRRIAALTPASLPRAERRRREREERKAAHRKQ